MGAGLALRAAAAQYQPPCGTPENPTCRFYAACQHKELACEAFRDFTLGVRVTVRRAVLYVPSRIPSRELFLNLYSEIDDA